jgi:LacI family transcriptional regulator
MPTLADVAKVAGVGVMSVSRVVHGTRKVSPETERKVRAAIARIGYQPNEAARMLKGHRARIIGLIVPDLADPFFASYANAVQETALNAGYMTLMAASAHQEEVERRETKIMIQRQVAGLLVTPTGSHDDHFAEAIKEGMPIVSFDRPLKHVEVDTLVVDNRAAASRATEHLIGHGHQHILCLADEWKIFTKAERVAGYSEAMRRAQLPVRVCLVGAISGSIADQLDLALNSKPAPTALFATSNVLALEALRELQKRSIQMPETMAVIAFDDFDAATLVRPTVTVVRQPVVELGRTATSMLLTKLSGEASSHQPSRVVLPTEFIIRESCGCPNRKNGNT